MILTWSFHSLNQLFGPRSSWLIVRFGNFEFILSWTIEMLIDYLAYQLTRISIFDWVLVILFLLVSDLLQMFIIKIRLNFGQLAYLRQSYYFRFVMRILMDSNTFVTKYLQTVLIGAEVSVIIVTVLHAFFGELQFPLITLTTAHNVIQLSSIQYPVTINIKVYPHFLKSITCSRASTILKSRLFPHVCSKSCYSIILRILKCIVSSQVD